MRLHAMLPSRYEDLVKRIAAIIKVMMEEK
jgi:hypothetical protein